MLISNLLFYFNLIFIILFFPSFISGVFLPNLLCFLFILLNLLFNFEKIKSFIKANKIIIFIFFCFYFFILLSSILSKYLYHSLESSLLYFLYLFYVISLITVFRENKNFLKYFLISGVFTIFFLSLDAYYELYKGYNIFGFSSIEGRIAGLFGDRWLIGRFLIYILPILISLYFFENKNLNKFFKFFVPIAILMSIFTIIFSGERAAYLLLIIFFIFIFCFLANKIKLNYLICITVILFIFIILPFLFTDTSNRLKSNFLLYLTSTDFEKNQYYSMWYSSINMFLDSPILGLGPNNFRFYCSELSYYVSKWSCSTHPHSITIQLLAETGMIGFLFVYSVFTFFLLKTLKLFLIKLNDSHTIGLFFIYLSVLLYLFPLMISGNFFLSWYGFIFYLPISLFYVYK